MITAIRAQEQNLDYIIKFVKDEHDLDLTFELSDTVEYNAEDGEDSYVVVSWRMGTENKCSTANTMTGSAFKRLYRFRADESDTEFIAIEKI